MTTVFALVGLAVDPLLAAMLRLSRQMGTYVVTNLPTLSQVVDAIQLPSIAVCAAAAWLLFRSTSIKRIATPSSTWTLILSWWLIPPAALLSLSWVTGN